MKERVLKVLHHSKNLYYGAVVTEMMHWSKEISMRCHSVHDLAAAEGQYHVRCYDNFRKVPVQTDQILIAEDEALKIKCMRIRMCALGHQLNYMTSM